MVRRKSVVLGTDGENGDATDDLEGMMPIESDEAEQRMAIEEAALSARTPSVRGFGQPYRMSISIIGTAPILFHAWKNVLPDDPDTAGKGDKKRDNITDYLYRNGDGLISIPGICFTAAIREAGRSMKDPRSPRASMKELIKASILPLTEYAPLEPSTKNWDFEHACRAVVQRNAITRIRPAMREGWMATFEVLISTPQYFPPHLVLKLAGDAGRLNGLCDFRPLYGRFTIRGSEVLED